MPAFWPSVSGIRLDSIPQPHTSCRRAARDATEPAPDDSDTGPDFGIVLSRIVTISISGVPADKIRDVVKVVVMPLASGGADLEVDLEIRAQNPTGISRNTLDLVVAEGLRQLGVEHSLTERSASD